MVRETNVSKHQHQAWIVLMCTDARIDHPHKGASQQQIPGWTTNISLVWPGSKSRRERERSQLSRPVEQAAEQPTWLPSICFPT